MLIDITTNIFNNVINFITGQNAQDRFVNLLDSSPNILSDKDQTDGYVGTDSNNEMLSIYYNENDSRANIITKSVAGLLVPNKFYQINDAVGSTITLQVCAENAFILHDFAIDVQTGEIGTYDITTDVFIPIVVSGTPDLQQVTTAGATTTVGVTVDNGAGESIDIKHDLININNALGTATITSPTLTTATEFRIPDKVTSPQTFAMLSDITGGSGDVVGPASAVSNNITLFDGTTGKLIKDGGVALSALVPYTGATADVDLGNNGLDAKFVKIKGTAGNGHLNLKHQSSAATAGGSESVLYADNSGNPAWKNDGNALQSLLTNSNITQVITNGVTDKAPSEDAVFDALALKTNTQTLTLFGTVITGTISDSVSYHMGNIATTPGSVDARRAWKFTSAGTVTAASFTLEQTTNGSGETVNIYLRNVTTATDTSIGTFTSNFGTSTTLKQLFSGLSIAVNTTDDYTIKITTPAFATNPANWIPSLTLQMTI